MFWIGTKDLEDRKRIINSLNYMLFSSTEMLSSSIPPDTDSLYKVWIHSLEYLNSYIWLKITKLKSKFLLL